MTRPSGPATVALRAVVAGLTALTLATAAAPQAHGVPAGTVVPGEYHTVGSDVVTRGCEDTDCSVTHVLHATGTGVRVYCWRTGTSVAGDPYWYDADAEDGSGAFGFVAGYWLDTGHDPNPAVPHCSID